MQFMKVDTQPRPSPSLLSRFKNLSVSVLVYGFLGLFLVAMVI